MNLKERTITDEEYIKEFQPIGVWLLVEKDVLPEKTASGLILAPKGRQDSLRFSGTGIIRGKAPSQWGVFEQSHDKYWMDVLKIGDRVGFSVQTPIMSPAPPQWQFASGGGESMKFIQITATDVTGVFLETDDDRREWLSRL